MIMVMMDIAFYSGACLYVAAAVLAVLYLRAGRPEVLRWTIILTGTGALLLLTASVLRGLAWKSIPLTTPADTLNLLVILCTALMASFLFQKPLRSLVCFCLPPLALICLITATAAHPYLHEAPRQLRGIPLTIHVGLAFLAYALFFLASLTSAAYTYQARHLKRHSTAGLFHRLPSLEQLDRTLYGMIRWGYPLFAITLLLGLYWSHAERDLLGPRWYLAPKILLSVVMAAFFSGAFHGRRTGILRGPKLAHFVFLGFTALLLAYVVLALLGLREYNFWEHGA